MKKLILAGAFMLAISTLSVSNVTAQNMANAKTAKSAEAEKGVMVGGALMVPSKNIVENALGSSDHTTLVAAVKAASLVETLSGTGPFTVFAPNNAAFGKLPAGTVDELIKPENKEKLTAILTLHVVPGALRAKDLKDGQTLKTVNGEMLTVNKKGGMVMINGAHVSIPDVISSNGVTHVVDTVILPAK